MVRLLLGSLIVLTAAFIIGAVITAMAPFIAIGLVLWVAWQLRPKSNTGGQLVNVTPQKSRE